MAKRSLQRGALALVGGRACRAVLTITVVSLLMLPMHTRPQRNDVLVMFAHTGSEEGRINLDFHLRHGVHTRADWIFLLNDTSSVGVPKRTNVRVIQHAQICGPFFAFAEALSKVPQQRYKHFIFLDDSMRGPFLPRWSTKCWTDAVTKHLRDDVKVP